MSPDPSFEPKSELGRQLLKAGRDDEPPEGATDRALELVESTFAAEEAPAPKRRWALWALPAAAVVVGVVVVAQLRESSTEQPVAEPVPTSTADPAPTATATAAATAKVATRPPASASASASASATVKVATRPPKGYRPKTSSGGKTAGTGSAGKTKPPPAKGACGCAAEDLMCQMRCGQK